MNNCKICFSEFIEEDRFELNEYLTCLFNQIHESRPKRNIAELEVKNLNSYEIF